MKDEQRGVQMGKPLDPGPPLTAGEEFCPDEPPSAHEYWRASFAAMALGTVLAGGWFVVAVATQRLWGVIVVLIGIALGLTVHRAAGRHRSYVMGAIAAGATLLAGILGYILLWMPFVSASVDRRIEWYHPLMLVLALFVAYRLAGPRATDDTP